MRLFVTMFCVQLQDMSAIEARKKKAEAKEVEKLEKEKRLESLKEQVKKTSGLDASLEFLKSNHPAGFHLRRRKPPPPPPPQDYELYQNSPQTKFN